jgi:hypothetical protein
MAENNDQNNKKTKPSSILHIYKDQNKNNPFLFIDENVTSHQQSESEASNELFGLLNFELPNWGIKDYINERTYWAKGTNLTAGNEPGWFYFKVFFKFNTGFGLFGGIFKDSAGKNYYAQNSALQYLDSLSAFKSYNYMKINERKLALYKFSSMLFDISIKTPWMIKGISNLQNAMNAYTQDFSNEKSFDLLFANETVDMRLSTLMDLYKFVCYDDINCKEILPENLRKFDMSIIIFHMPLKYIQTGISAMKFGKTEKIFNTIDNIGNTASKLFGNSKAVNVGVNVVDSICSVAKAFTTKSLLYDYKTMNTNNGDFSNTLSFKMFTFQNCEIDTSSFGKYFESVEMKNETPFQFGSSALKIKYDRVYYHNMNEWNRFMFGSDGFYYNAVKPDANLLYSCDVKTLNKGEITIKNNGEKSNPYEYKPIISYDPKNDTWESRLNALVGANEAGYYNNNFSDSQWKPLLDFSEIAIYNSLRDYDMGDMVFTERGILYDTKTGNIYENFTNTSDSKGIIGHLLGTSRGQYFIDKMEFLSKNQNETSNLFANISSNVSDIDRMHNYYKYKLNQLASREITNGEDKYKSIINDALNIYNINNNSNISLIETNNIWKKQSNNIYGDFGPKFVSSKSFNDAKNISDVNSKLNEMDISTANSLNNLLFGNLDNIPKEYYFERKMSRFIGVGDKGNLFGRDLTNSYLTSKQTPNEYFLHKFSLLSTINNTSKLFGNIFDYNYMINNSGDLTEYSKSKFSYIKNGNASGNIFDYDFITYGSGYISDYAKDKITYLKSSPSFGNIFDYNYMINNSGELTEYSKSKFTYIKSGNAFGNIFDYDFITYGSGYISDYAKDKITQLKNGTIYGNVFDYNFTTYNGNVTDYFYKKIHSSLNSTDVSYTQTLFNVDDAVRNEYNEIHLPNITLNVANAVKNEYNEKSYTLINPLYSGAESNDFVAHSYMELSVTNNIENRTNLNLFNEKIKYDENGNVVLIKYSTPEEYSLSYGDVWDINARYSYATINDLEDNNTATNLLNDMLYNSYTHVFNEPNMIDEALKYGVDTRNYISPINPTEFNPDKWVSGWNFWKKLTQNNSIVNAFL